MKKLRLFSAVSVILVLLMAAAPAFAADPNPGKGNTDVVVVNTNRSGPAADVQAVYYSPDGVIKYSRSQPINAEGSYTFLASGAPLGDNWIGSMILQSDAEVAAIAQITWSDGSAPDGTTAGAYRGYAFGSTTMYLPYAVYSPDAQFSRITVQNTADSPAEITIEWKNRDGVVDGIFTDTIQGLGSKTYDTHVPSPQVPVWNTVPFFTTNGAWNGALKITSTNGKELTAVVTNHWHRWAIAYNGVITGATNNYVPSAERRVDPSAGWRGFSIVVAQCLESSTQCQVKLEYVNGGTGSVDLTLNRTLQPGAALGSNTRNGGDFGADTYLPLGGAWAGSVIVSTTNNTDIAVIAYSIRPGTNIAGSTSGANATEAGTETFLPVIYQLNRDGVSCPSDFNTDWNTFSQIRIQNPSGSNANNVQMNFFNTDGSLKLAVDAGDIPAAKSVSWNTRNHCATLDLGGTWSGNLYITSDVPVVAVAETIWGNIKMDSYNGYSINR